MSKFVRCKEFKEKERGYGVYVLSDEIVYLNLNAVSFISADRRTVIDWSGKEYACVEEDNPPWGGDVKKSIVEL